MIQILAGLLIAAVGLFIFFHQVKLPELWKQIEKTSIWVLLGVAVLNPIGLWIRALRWRIMLPSSPNSDKRGLFALVMIGFMTNNILPARLGEAARAALLWKRNGFTVAVSVGSLVLERFIDALVFSSFFFIPVFFIKGLSPLVPYAAVMAGGFLVAVLCLIFYKINPGFSTRISKVIVRKLPSKISEKILKIGKELISNIDWIFSFKKLAVVAFYSYLCLFCQVGMMLLLGLGIKGFGVLDSMFGIAFAAFGAAIPLAPGYVGTLHATLLRGLSLLGVTSDKAGAIAVIYHAIGYLVITLIGLLFLLSIKISLKDINNAKASLEGSDVDSAVS